MHSKAVTETAMGIEKQIQECNVRIGKHFEDLFQETAAIHVPTLMSKRRFKLTCNHDGRCKTISIHTS